MTEKNQKLKKLIDSSKKIGLITHRDGDGDAFGSMMALKRMLDGMGKETIIFSNEPWPQIMEFLEEKVHYLPKAQWEKVDLLVGLDANSQKRFILPEIFDEAKNSGAKILIIDHHLKGDIEKIADVYLWNTKTSSTSEIIFNLVAGMKQKIDKITASLLLLGIETDTFSLQFTNTTPETFIAVAELLRKGARLKPIIENAFGGRPIPTVKLLGRAIKRLELDGKTGAAVTYVKHSDIKDLNLTEQSSSGVANFLDQIEGAKVVAVVEEREPNLVKVSLRSNNSDIDVEKIAKSFGGGGHEKAAGFEVSDNLEKVLKKIKEKLLTS